MLKINICCSCKREFSGGNKETGNFCPQCNHRIKLKLKWRGYSRRLLTNVSLSSQAREKTEKRMAEINAKLILEFGIDMTKDKIGYHKNNIKH